jgi:hypothetical protein
MMFKKWSLQQLCMAKWTKFQSVCLYAVIMTQDTRRGTMPARPRWSHCTERHERPVQHHGLHGCRATWLQCTMAAAQLSAAIKLGRLKG